MSAKRRAASSTCSRRMAKAREPRDKRQHNSSKNHFIDATRFTTALASVSLASAPSLVRHDHRLENEKPFHTRVIQVAHEWRPAERWRTDRTRTVGVILYPPEVKRQLALWEAESIKKPVLKPPSGLGSRQGESPDTTFGRSLPGARRALACALAAADGHLSLSIASVAF
jgi:hypothetical protein